MALLALSHIVKDFPGVRALDDVSFDLDAGEVHALVGENGAGKSTLIKVIGGVWPCGSYRGSILIDGAEQHFHSVRESEHARIRIIHQELALVSHMTAAENIYLGNEPMSGFVIDSAAMRKGAAGAMQRLNCGISPDARVGDLTVGQRQLVEIAKALSTAARIIVFDEPTAALPERDAESLLALVESLKRQGMGIVYISHKLNEVCRIADRITVLRNGCSVSSYRRGDYTTAMLVKDMIGRSLDTVFPQPAPVQDKEVLAVRNVTLRKHGNAERAIIKDVSFAIRAGEVVGLAGLLGSGRTALMSLFYGTFQGSWTGNLELAGQEYRPQAPDQALSKGVSLVTEDRKNYGLLPLSDVQENLAIASLRRFRKGVALDFARTARECHTYSRKLNIKTPSLLFPVINLSGGNQQKVILGRFLMTSPRLLLLDDPTRGVDVGAKHEIYRIIHELAREGLGVLFASSELPEVLGVAHRVIVLHNGMVRAQFEHGQASEEDVLALAAGV